MEIEESAEATAKGTSTLIAQSVVSGIFRISNIMVLTRLLPVEQMGQIAILAVIYGFMQFLGALGLNHASPLVIPQYEDSNAFSKIKAYLNRSVILILVSSIGLVVVLWIFSPLILTGATLTYQALLLITVVAPFSSLETFLDSFVLARYETTNLAVGRVLFDATRMICSVLLVFTGFGVEGVVLGWLAAEIIAIIVFGMSAVRGVPQKAGSIEMRSILTFALPSLAFQTIDVTIQNTDRIILVQLAGLASLGVYDVILGLLFMMSFVSLTVASSLYPIFTRIRLNSDESSKREESISRVSTILVRYILLLLIPLAMIVAMNSSIFLAILFGAPYAQFANSALVLSILVLAYSLWGAAYGLQTVLRSVGEARYFIYSGVGIILFEVVGCYWMTLTFGLLGCALVRAFYIIFLLTAAIIRLRQKGVVLGKRLVSSITKILVASLLSGLLVYLASPDGLISLAIWSIIALLGYLLTLFLVREVDELDFRLARSLFPDFMLGSLNRIHELYIGRRQS